MSLALTSMRPEEIRTLADFDKKTQILVVKEDEQGQSKIVAYSRDHLSCWDFFLRLFNYGTLAHTKVRLVDVAAHLGQYNIVRQYVVNANTPENAVVKNIWSVLNDARMKKRHVIETERIRIPFVSARDILRP